LAASRRRVWTAPAKRSGYGVFSAAVCPERIKRLALMRERRRSAGNQNGVALRLPPQSKKGRQKMSG